MVYARGLQNRESGFESRLPRYPVRAVVRQASRSSRRTRLPSSPMLARHLSVAALTGLLLLAAPANAAELRPVEGPTTAQVGIAEQKASAFDDARLRDLDIGHARRSVPWDALRFRDQTADLDRWIEGARAAGAQPLITFARSRSERRRHSPPGPAEFLTQFRRFRARYPAVRSYVTWNEANHCGEGTCRRPELVARYYSAIRRNCKGCKVVAADLVDQPNLVSWVRAFRRAARFEPRYWGLHNYVDANRFATTRTAQLLRAVKGEVWLTETGGLVARRNRSTTKLRQGRVHAAKVTRFIFDRLARLSPRITRIYVYHWSSSTRRDTWDSALIGSDGAPRPALAVLRRVLRQAESRRARARRG